MSYNQDFKDFLKNTNEKKILSKAIIKECEVVGARSLLDIGAGGGEISIPLAQAIPNYVAVEPNKAFANNLRSYNIEVLEECFPLAAPQRGFDVILSCHSLSYSKQNYEPFIRGVAQSLSVDGYFFLVIFRGMKDKWTRLLSEIGEDRTAEYQENFYEILRQLHGLGVVTTRTIKTHVQTRHAAEMIRALSFVYSDGSLVKKAEFLKKKKQVKAVLDMRHKYSNGYSFVFDHLFIKLKKTQVIF